jgi:hypothetical protein
MEKRDKIKIINELTESYGISPWRLLNEAEDVSSDDEPDATDNSLSDEDKQGIIQGLISQDLSEEDFQKMIKSKEINDEDAQEIMQAVQQSQQEEEPSEEEIQMGQINQVQDMVVRFSLYDKYNKLLEKVNFFLDYFTDIKSDLYSEVNEIKEYLEIISSLLFNLEINILYQLYFKLEDRLITSFTEYQNQG